MPKKSDYNKTQRLNIASIVQRLPLHKHMSQSQSALIELSPIWHAWSANNLTSKMATQVSLTSLQNGQLIVSCANAVSASQIKHQYASLLESLTASGFTNVKRIKVRIDHGSSTTDNESTSDNQTISRNDVSAQGSHQSIESANTTRKPTYRAKPNSKTIKSIEHCQKLTSNDKLSDSLKRLASTLNKLD